MEPTVCDSERGTCFTVREREPLTEVYGGGLRLAALLTSVSVRPSARFGVRFADFQHHLRDFQAPIVRLSSSHPAVLLNPRLRFRTSQHEGRHDSNDRQCEHDRKHWEATD